MISAASAFAQKASKRESAIFQKGIEDYLAGNYDLAEKNFSTVIAKLKDNHLLTANILMLAKTWYKKGDYQQSLTKSQYFINQFPQSGYVDDFHLLSGNCYFRLGNNDLALNAWFKAAEANPESPLARLSLKHSDDLIRQRYDMEQLVQLKQISQGGIQRTAVLYLLAERYYEAGSSDQALVLLEEARLTKSPYSEKIERLLSFLKNNHSEAIRIAALLPLSGDNAYIGHALLDGAKMALDVYNRAHGVSVELIAFDYQTRLATALNQVKEIARDRTITAVFGPVEDDITAACAAIASYENLTLISPTATDQEIREFSGSAFLLAPPVDVSANRLARFAIDSLGLKQVAVLAPLDDYFVRFSRLFMDRLRESGHEVAAELWYDAGQQDLGKYFTTLKKTGLKLAPVDTSVVTTSESDIAEIDSSDIAVNAYDGILLPVFRDDISVIASQYAYSNIHAQVLGNEDWYDVETLKKNRNYINGLVFVSDGYLNEENWDYRQFRNNFRLAYKRTPERMELNGYDSFNFILTGLPEDLATISRDTFAEIMQQAPNYNGIYRSFTVGQKRYNSSVRLLKFIYGQIVPLN
jgi:ABC-type branched-subunit amino acid transport system substrate-binding protein